MLTHPQDPSLYLIESAQVAERGDSLPQHHIAALLSVVSWARSFLCAPNPSMGRAGPVCPFAEPAMQRRLFWLYVFDGDVDESSSVRRIVLAFREWLTTLEPTQGAPAKLKTILILFPSVPPVRAPDLIDRVQRSLKRDFVADGLMIGQFHPNCPEPGLHSHDFRPLQSPIPLLAIRHMVPTDLPFLRNDPECVAAYRRVMSAQGVPQGGSHDDDRAA